MTTYQDRLWRKNIRESLSLLDHPNLHIEVWTAAGEGYATAFIPNYTPRTVEHLAPGCPNYPGDLPHREDSPTLPHTEDPPPL